MYVENEDSGLGISLLHCWPNTLARVLMFSFYCFLYTTVLFYENTSSKQASGCMDYSFYDKNIFHLEMSLNILGRRNILCVNITLVDVTATDIILHD